MTNPDKHPAALSVDDGGGVALERRADREIGSDKEPGVAASLHHRLAGTMSQGICIVSPVNRGRRADIGSQARGRGAGREKDLVLGARYFLHGKRYSGIWYVNDDVDALGVDPPVRDPSADIGLV